MTDFHWSDFAVPAMLLIVFMIIAIATWLLHLLFPSPRATPKADTIILDQSADHPMPRQNNRP